MHPASEPCHELPEVGEGGSVGSSARRRRPLSGPVILFLCGQLCGDHSALSEEVELKQCDGVSIPECVLCERAWYGLARAIFRK